LAHEVGLANVIAMAHSLGVTETIPQYPSIVLGSIAVHPIEMAAAYAAVADGGVYHAPTFIDHILDRSGATIYTGTSPGKRVFSAQVAGEATIAFRAVVQSGTGTAAALYNRQVAGKTGTTSSNVDAWFNGFTPQLEASVWMGNISAEVPMTDVGGITVYGATYPAHTWHDFAAAALASQPAIPLALANPGLLPPTKYITSPGLVADDVLDHNYSAPVYSPPSYYTTPTNNPTPAPPPPNPPPGHKHGGGNSGQG
jgi:membrane peptidoglycan carboxypeptidase